MQGAFSLDARPGPAPGALRVRFSAGRLSPSQCSPVPVLGLPSALRHGTCPHFLRVSRRRCPSPAVLPKAAEAKILAGAGTSCGAAGVVGLEVPDCPKCSYQTPDTAARREASDRCHVSAPGRIATAQTAPPPRPRDPLARCTRASEVASRGALAPSLAWSVFDPQLAPWPLGDLTFLRDSRP